MKVVILADGYGTRLSEESTVQAEAPGRDRRPADLRHIMKIYSADGLNDFIMLCGYKGHLIKRTFATMRWPARRDLRPPCPRDARPSQCVDRGG